MRGITLYALETFGFLFDKKNGICYYMSKIESVGDMGKYFKNQLDLICDNDKINDKLMIVSLYNEFYNSILGSASDFFIRQYKPLMEKTFEFVVATISLQKDIEINANQFMNLYFKFLKISKLSNVNPAKEIIEYFEHDVNSLTDSMKYVTTIDQLDFLSFSSKVDLMVQFREFINHMMFEITKFYEEENGQKIGYDVFDILTNKLEQQLNPKANSISFELDVKPEMMISTKDYFIEKLKNGEFIENGIKEEVKDFLFHFNELEQKILCMGTIYEIAGYDKNSKTAEKKEEICALLGIPKSEYTRIMISIAFHYIKYIKENKKKTFKKI